ncbi:hypothetical protein GGS21DRAFT_511283, partial [Xylaria nigripes]
MNSAARARAHHGSRSHGGNGLLSNTRPRAAIASILRSQMLPPCLVSFLASVVVSSLSVLTVCCSVAFRFDEEGVLVFGLGVSAPGILISFFFFSFLLFVVFGGS